jgi:hypothetical protein
MLQREGAREAIRAASKTLEIAVLNVFCQYIKIIEL